MNETKASPGVPAHHGILFAPQLQLGMAQPLTSQHSKKKKTVGTIEGDTPQCLKNERPLQRG
jgi:hypothetical protein